MSEFNKIETGSIKIGVRFSKPLYFEDVENLFLPANCSVRAYHISALKKWKIPFLLTEGIQIFSNLAEDSEDKTSPFKSFELKEDF